MSLLYEIEKTSNGMLCIRLENKLVAELTKNNNNRVICTLNNSTSIHCAIIKNKTGEYLVYIGLKTCKELGIKVGDKISATFKIDESTFQFNMPEELEAVLQSDEEAINKFMSLTDGNKRGLMYLVTQVKSTDKRIERSLQIASKIKMGITSPRLILKKK